MIICFTKLFWSSVLTIPRSFTYKFTLNTSTSVLYDILVPISWKRLCYKWIKSFQICQDLVVLLWFVLFKFLLSDMVLLLLLRHIAFDVFLYLAHLLVTSYNLMIKSCIEKALLSESSTLSFVILLTDSKKIFYWHRNPLFWLNLDVLFPFPLLSERSNVPSCVWRRFNSFDMFPLLHALRWVTTLLLYSIFILDLHEVVSIWQWLFQVCVSLSSFLLSALNSFSICHSNLLVERLLGLFLLCFTVYLYHIFELFLQILILSFL